MPTEAPFTSLKKAETMSIQTLSNVTLETIENYRNAAATAVDAYRVGSHRLIDAVNGSLDKNFYGRTEKVLPQLTSRLTQVRGNVSGIIVKGVDEFALRTGKAIELGSKRAAARIAKAAKYAAGLEARIVASSIDAAARLSMPGAQAALAVSARVAEGVDSLSRVAAGKKAKAVRVATVKKAVAGARRKVARKAAATKATAGRKMAAPRKAVAATKAKVARAKREVAAAIEA